MNQIGKAYGFFDCRASKPEIEAEVPFIRELISAPSELELSLIEGIEHLKGDADLLALAQNNKRLVGLRYVLKATYPNETNRETAEELATLLAQVYQTPLYEPDDPFFGEIVYKEGGYYLFVKKEEQQ